MDSGYADMLASMRQRASTLPAAAAGVGAPGAGAGAIYGDVCTFGAVPPLKSSASTYW